MNADSDCAATALCLQLRGANRASDIDAMPAPMNRRKRFLAHDAGDHASLLVNSDLGYTSRIDQALGCPKEPLVQVGTRIKLKVRIGHKRQTRSLRVPNFRASLVCLETVGARTPTS